MNQLKQIDALYFWMPYEVRGRSDDWDSNHSDLTQIYIQYIYTSRRNTREGIWALMIHDSKFFE